MPRAPSSVPRPVAVLTLATVAGVGVSRATFRSTRPAPCARGSASGSFSAVFVSSALTPSGVMPGRWPMTSAAAPETNAAD